MNRSKRNRTTLEMGHDAFLDIVANLVGILIILVVVLGTQSQSVIEQVRQQNEVESPESETIEDATATDQQFQRLSQVTMRAQAAQADSDRFEKKIQLMEKDLATRGRQRGVLLDLLTEAKSAWAEAKEKLDQERTVLAARQSEMQKLRSQMVDLQDEQQRLESQKDPVIAVEHLPTPMAKTVFGDEIHFRLKDNRLSVVPIEKLIGEIRRDFQRVARGPREGKLDAAVGPVHGYVARYVMEKRREMMVNGSGVGSGTRIALLHMTVEPLSEPHGQPIADVLSQSQLLDVELAGRNPNATTITVWVYPDSFGAFRHLKEHLYAKGFATAARPLTMDRAITGGPQGSRSAAQ